MHPLLFSIDFTVSLSRMAFESWSEPCNRKWKSVKFRALCTACKQNPRVVFFVSKDVMILETKIINVPPLTVSPRV